MTTLKSPDQLLPLSPAVFQILLAIAEKDRHGYAIIQEVERWTQGNIRLSSGTLYAAIRRLLDAGLIVEASRRPAPEADDERRRYYRITEFGTRVAAAEARRLENLVELARRQPAVAEQLAREATGE